MQERLIKEIFSNMEKGGFARGTEQYEICNRAIHFLGFSYQRDEELNTVDTVVDCSTLTSQSHWEGALIGIPFVADSQRRANSGAIISSINQLAPADVLIKFPSIEESPDKTWNHVGLYLGKDSFGTQWLIESTSKTGVRISRVEDFNAQGGIRRFTLSSDIFVSRYALQAISLAKSVPKLGRLGARQYRKSNTNRPMHKGLDLYTEEGTPVYATISGIAIRCIDEIEHTEGVEIFGDTMTVRYMSLSGISIDSSLFINKGQLLGYVASPPSSSDIVYSSIQGRTAHLHLTVEVTTSLERKFGYPVIIEDKMYYNYLYLAKLGFLPLPFQT